MVKVDESGILLWGLIIGVILILATFVPIILKGFAQVWYSLYSMESTVSEEVSFTPHERKEFPFNFSEFIGQTRTVENLKISIHVAKKEVTPLPHTLFYGMPGLGKTTLAELIAQEMAVPFISIEGGSLDSKDGIVSVVNQITEGTIVFIDEIHQISHRMSEVWYKIMENYTMDIVGDTVYNVDVPRFTTIGATTDFGKLLKPFRDRFVHLYELAPYTVQELFSIIRLIGSVSEETAKATAEISQYTPRLAKNYVRAMTEYASYSNRSEITVDDFNKLIRLKNITKFGLTDAQMRVLHSLAKAGDKMGKNALAMAASISMVDLEELVEPYLVIRGFIARTPRGREITAFGKAILSDIKI